MLTKGATAMDDQAMMEAVIESANVFLNGEVEGFDPSKHVDAEHFARIEVDRFGSILRSYLYERIDAGDYVDLATGVQVVRR
jgi:hypothetical protein